MWFGALYYEIFSDDWTVQPREYHGVICHNMVLRTLTYVKSSETSRVACVEMQPNLYITFIMYKTDTYNNVL